MRSNKFLFSICFGLLFFTASCGPMNKEVQSDKVITGTFGQETGPAKVTTNNKFYVSMNLENANTIHEGENIFVIRSVRANDLHPLASDAKITVL